MSRLTREGIAEPVSRDQIRANADREIFIFPVRLTTSRIGNRIGLVYVMTTVYSGISSGIVRVYGRRHQDSTQRSGDVPYPTSAITHHVRANLSEAIKDAFSFWFSRFVFPSVAFPLCQSAVFSAPGRPYNPPPRNPPLRSPSADPPISRGSV